MSSTIRTLVGRVRAVQESMDCFTDSGSSTARGTVLILALNAVLPVMAAPASRFGSRNPASRNTLRPSGPRR